MPTGNRTRSIVAVGIAAALVALGACGDDGNGEVAGTDAKTAAADAADAIDAAATEPAAGDTSAAAGDTSAAAAGAATGSAAPSARYEHQFAESYAGPVWITISSEADAAAVMITWGPYSVSFEHRGATASYWFTKSAADAPGAGVPVTVMVAPAATVTFHEGEPPADAIDVNEGWTQAS